MSNKTSKQNGRKGGRPNYKLENKLEIPNIKTVFLTPYQYSTLINKYGTSIITCAINILENWLSSSRAGEKYKGKNNYGHFRSDGWLINTAKQLILKSN